MNIDSARNIGYNEVYFTFDCIGDTILLISALEYLFKKKNKKILIGTYYKELTFNCEYIDILDGFCEENFDLHYYHLLVDKGITPIFISATDFYDEKGVYRPIWGKQHILANYCAKLGVNSLIEIAPKIFLTDMEKKRGKLFEEKQIAIISSGNQQYKAIPYSIAQNIVSDLKNEYHFVQLGCKTDPLLLDAVDCRECGGLRETASILCNSDLFIGGIGGLMHMARAVGCRSVIAFSSAEPLYLEKYDCNINVFASEPKCDQCSHNKSFPYLNKCSENYTCIKKIKIDCMEEAIELQMKKIKMPLETATCYVDSNEVLGIEDYIKRFGQVKEK